MASTILPEFRNLLYADGVEELPLPRRDLRTPAQGPVACLIGILPTFLFQVKLAQKHNSLPGMPSQWLHQGYHSMQYSNVKVQTENSYTRFLAPKPPKTACFERENHSQ